MGSRQRVLTILIFGLLGIASASAAYPIQELLAVQTSREAEVRELREKEIEQLRVTLGRRPEMSRRADLYFRLAELYLEAYQHEFILEGRVFERKWKSMPSSGGGARKGQARVMDRGASRRYLERGIAVSRELVALKIPYAKMDAVFYFLGFNYNELGKTKESVVYFRQLVTRYPQSPFVAEAYREIGESEFKAGRFEAALVAYQKAVTASGKNADVLPSIYHRLAWAHYRTRQYDRAVEVMKKAVAQILNSGGEGKFVALKEEALRDLALFLSEAGRPEEGIRYFQQLPASTSDRVQAFLILSKEFEKSLRYDQAEEIYRYLLKQSLSEDMAYRVRGKLIDVNLKRGHPLEALAVIESLPELPSDLSPFPDSEELLTIQKNIPGKVRRTATERHEAARKMEERAGSPAGSMTAARGDALKTAEAYYEFYLNRFVIPAKEKSRETSEIKMYLAEIKADLGKWDESGRLYQDVMKSGDARYRKEASALWAESLTRRLTARRSQGLSRSDRPSDLEMEFVHAADKLGQEVPNSHEARESALRSAQILAGYPGTEEEGLERAQQLVRKYPSSPQAVVAAKLWIQGLRETAEKSFEFGPVQNAVAELKANQEFRSQKDAQAFVRELGGVGDALRAKYITSLQSKGRLEEAARESLQLSRDSPNPSTRETAFVAALDQTLQIGRVTEAAAYVLERVKASAREPRDVQNRTAVMAKAFASRLFVEGDFEASAKLFQNLSEFWKDPALGQTSFWIWKALGRTSEAFAIGRAAVDFAGKMELRWRLLAELAQLQPELWAECAQGVNPLTSECAARAGDLASRQGHDAEAQKWYLRAAEAGSKSPWAGYGLYQTVVNLEKSRSFPKLTFSQAELQQALEARLKFFETLNTQYARVVGLGGPFAVAALDRVAAWTLDFTNELSALEIPSDLSDAEKLQARKTLAGVIQPLTKQASQTWVQAFERAAKNDLLSPALVEVSHRLAELGLRRGGFSQGIRNGFRLAGRGVGDEEALRKLRKQLQGDSATAGAWVDYGNWLWKERRPGLARIAYDRALAINPQDPAARTNRAIVEVMDRGPEDWAIANSALASLKQALGQSQGAAPGTLQAIQQNLAALYGYYRQFARAVPHAEKAATTEWAGLDMSAAVWAGAGQARRAKETLDRANARASDRDRFGHLYLKAALSRTRGGSEGLSECKDALEDLDKGDLQGFERRAYDLLWLSCGGRS